MAQNGTHDDIVIASYPDLRDKIVFLTGIGQSGDQEMWGNGAATSRLLAKQGAKIFGCDLYLEPAQHTQKRIVAEGGDVTVVAADVTNDESVKSAVDACLAKHGRIDILINNVGRSEPGGPAEMTEKVWDAQTNVNLKSVYLCCHHILPLMEKQGSGAVVNVASIAGLRYIGKPQVAYAATKAAVIQFTKATAVIYASKNIRMNVVVPGLMNTPLVGMLADKYAGGDVEGFKAKRNKAVPMGRMGDSFDVAMTALFLASSQSRYITGQKIVVDGGITSSTG
ncbi:3-oxoacyl-[acyl-carrier-protein] reductase FabG [Colletotrichum fructicola]|uniref:3-oxoacyl-[acyl-carrier-protein] reductase FabG n=1 Tax=Colletotrichum fructicola (strain Nara gc5) TaxID=1213859 RepID=L2FUD1_COLFN|nr:3-oxoacyl-[acyl-carrier-protein] reductase FabG [Colletotrichum fructicola Nara gc5]KAF4888978.1 3-oxoacyl-[acyl-carrier-protein] reductase FabG [Colletotrichum fructicola]KAF4904990.1 3-oxoacyl-[acyl-carrier-protein] reductase FabG [Colletotrichum fructicola]KAF4933202.1 3-oxoacyl-[acyl-carrier-protein] reductase FabG [Colletotrichum fructicola]